MRAKLGMMVTTMAVATGALMFAGPARADEVAQRTVAGTEQNGVCESGELCLYYNSNCKGSLADFYFEVENFASFKFISGGNGKGQTVKNNAASARNREPSLTARVYFNSGYKGVYDDIPGDGACHQLDDTYNENASFDWH